MVVTVRWKRIVGYCRVFTPGLASENPIAAYPQGSGCVSQRTVGDRVSGVAAKSKNMDIESRGLTIALNVIFHTQTHSKISCNKISPSVRGGTYFLSGGYHVS